jgi:hypothetical protein
VALPGIQLLLAANIFHVRDGRVSEVWELHDDPAGNAWLWA